MRLSRRTISLVFPILIVLMTLAAYAPAMRAGFIWDDDAYLTENPVYHYSNPLARIWQVNPVQTPQYYPLVFTSFYLEQKLWGLNPVGFHVFNVLLHAGSAILLWLVLRKLKVPGAMFGAAVFALHPTMVESVAWVTERKNTFSSFFFLASLLCFVVFFTYKRTWKRVLPEGSTHDLEGGKLTYPLVFYALSLLFFIAALLSKSVACGLAPVLVLILWWKKRPLFDYLLTIPYWVIGLASGLFTAYLEQTHVGAHGQAWQLSIVDKILLAGRAICFYAGKLLFPWDLSFYYTRWQIDPSAVWQWAFPVLVLAVLGALLAATKRIGRAPFVAAAAFFVLLFPALGFFALFPMIFSWVADHFAYLATVAFIPLVCAALAMLAHRLLPGRFLFRVLLALPILFLLGVKTYSVSTNYESNGTLFKSVLDYDDRHGEPHHWNALSIVSGQLHQKAQEFTAAGQPQIADGLIEQAFQFDQESREVYKKMVPGGGDYAVGLNNIAGYYIYKKDYAKAMDYLQQAMKADPNNYEFLVTLGNLYRDMGQLGEAAKTYQRVVTIKPRNAHYRVKLGRLLLEMGNTQLAAQFIDSAIQVDPTDVDAHTLRGFLLTQQGKLGPALEELRTALALDPNNLEAMDTFCNIVAVYPQASDADVKKALSLANEVVDRTQGGNIDYVDTLAMMLNRAGRAEEAVRLLQRAIPRVPPTNNATRQTMIQQLMAYSGGKATVPPFPTTAPSTQASAAPATTTQPAATR